MILTSTEEEASMILGTVHKVYSWNPCTSHFPCRGDEMPGKAILGTRDLFWLTVPEYSPP